MGERTSPSGEELPPAFIAADEALVALELEMTVFNVEREEHASRIARKEIGQRLQNIPLDVLEIEVLEDDDDDEDDDDEAVAEETDSDETGEADEETAEASTTETESDVEDTASATKPDAADDGPEDDVLPEFEELIDE